MALLADLRDLAQCRAYTQLCADRQRVHRHTFNKDILGKRTVLELKAEFFLKLCNTVDRQQTHLSVPIAGMGISLDAPVLFQKRLGDLMLLYSPYVTYANCGYLRHFSASYTVHAPLCLAALGRRKRDMLFRFV